MDSFVSPKDEIWFLRVCHHISNAVYCRLFVLDRQLLMSDDEGGEYHDLAGARRIPFLAVKQLIKGD